MRKLVNGKLYDTEVSTLICSATNTDTWDIYRSWEEELYKTKNWNYFIVGCGWPSTDYATSIPWWITWSKKLETMSVQEAIEWFEGVEWNYIEGRDALLKEFADKIESA